MTFVRNSLAARDKERDRRFEQSGRFIKTDERAGHGHRHFKDALGTRDSWSLEHKWQKGLDLNPQAGADSKFFKYESQMELLTDSPRAGVFGEGA